ncbi:MAG: ORF6N domain-containing protein [Candidatus Omnitrophica bacterium]|nr:ORF6N domain-containing protein [Candidatus Omnitrophota bacterium]
MPRSLSVEVIATRIYMIRGQRVMLDKDLAELYGVSVKVLNQSVSRNIKRFPGDFMYQLTRQEVANLKSQFVTSSSETSVAQGVIDSRSQIATLNSEVTTAQNVTNLMFQNGTSRWGGTRKLPSVFTEQGVAMLSSVLNSERSIQVNIMIMRAFVKLKELLLTHKDLADKIAELERKYDTHDDQIQLIFEAIKKLLEPVPPPQPESKKPPIGFSKD